MTDERKYSVEIIRRYRKMEKANVFVREMKERHPVDLDFDEVTYSCGHKAKILATALDALPGGGKLSCRTCAEEWLASHV
jgi:hypothetical protein